jgi:hypothetical protein
MDIELKPGEETSEYKMTKWVNIAAIVLAVAGAALEAVAQAGYGVHWVGIALTIVGVLTKLINTSGYRTSREMLKARAIEAVETVGAEEARSIKDVPAALAALRTAQEDAEVAEDLRKVQGGLVGRMVKP